MLCSHRRRMAARFGSADERPLRLEKGKPKDSSKQTGVARRRRNEGLAPVRDDIGSKRVRPRSGRYFPGKSARFMSGPDSKLMISWVGDGMRLLRIRPFRMAAVGRCRLK